VVQAAAGYEDSLAVTSTGQLYSFGNNGSGELGTTTNSDTLNPNPTPALISLAEATGPVVQVDAGSEQSLVVTSTGQLFAFGSNTGGQLGRTPYTNVNPTPTLVGLPGSVDTVARGTAALFSLVVVSDLSISTASLARGAVGSPYNARLLASGGRPPDAWSVTGLPAGVAANDSTGAITGTPNRAGTFSVIATVNDGDGIHAVRTLALHIAPTLTALTVSPRRLSLAGRQVHGHCVSPTHGNRFLHPCREALRLHLSFHLSTTGNVTIELARLISGREVHGGCVKPTRANRKDPHCTRLINLPGRVVRGAAAGATRIKLAHRALSPGRYRLSAFPSAAGQTGSAKEITITVTG
jgi:hypothetical protein